MYASDQGGQFPTGGSLGSVRQASSTANTERESLGKLFDQYVTDRKVFKCPSDTSVSDAPGFGVMNLTTTVTSFTATTCSYGYDDNHTTADDTGTAIAADKLGSVAGDTQTLSYNHKNKGQNVLYIDGHVEWKGTSTAGYYDPLNINSFDNIWFHAATLGTVTGSLASRLNSSAGTDTSILQ